MLVVVFGELEIGGEELFLEDFCPELVVCGVACVEFCHHFVSEMFERGVSFVFPVETFDTGVELVDKFPEHGI